MTGMRLLLTVLLAANAIVAASLAASAGEADSEPGSPALQTVVGGSAQECHDYRGRAVATFRVTELGDVGRAGIVAQTPFIMLDEEILRRLPDKLQIFFYLHECGHLTLGHWMNYAPDHENEADCWAIRRGRDRRLFSRQEVVDFAPWLAQSRGDAFGHPPGPERSRRLVTCFDEPPQPGATMAAQ